MSKRFNTQNLNLTYDEDDVVEESNISSRILNLSDQLAEEIILENINMHISGEASWVGRTNYLTLYREKVEEAFMDPDNLDLKEFISEITERVIVVTLSGLKQRYSVTMGQDLEDATDILTYLKDIETLYEFFFVRNYENLKDLIYHTLITKKSQFVAQYQELYEDQEEDLFIATEKKKFKNFSDALICNFITDIIYDIKEMYHSASDLFNAIVNLDLYENYNNQMNDLLIKYGDKIVFLSDTKAADKYFSLINNKEIFIMLRNDVLYKYLENVEVEADYGNN